MIFAPTVLKGVVTVEADVHPDDRGEFMRTWCKEEYERQGMIEVLAQCSVSTNAKRGTLRGMHWQSRPNVEAKTVRCLSGSAYDVVVDVRPGSPTFLKWVGVELSGSNRRAIYIPPLCAHGFITLEDATELEYLISSPYRPEAARGIRWDDPAVGIQWPLLPLTMSVRDQSFELIASGDLRWME